MLQVEIEGNVCRKRRRCRSRATGASSVRAGLLMRSSGHYVSFTCIRRRYSVLAGEIASRLVVPCVLVVGFLVGVPAGKETVVGKLEAFFDDQCGVGVVDEVLLGHSIMLQGVIDEPAKEGYVGAGTNLKKE